MIKIDTFDKINNKLIVSFIKQILHRCSCKVISSYIPLANVSSQHQWTIMCDKYLWQFVWIYYVSVEALGCNIQGPNKGCFKSWKPHKISNQNVTSSAGCRLNFVSVPLLQCRMSIVRAHWHWKMFDLDCHSTVSRDYKTKFDLSLDDVYLWTQRMLSVCSVVNNF